MANPRQLQDAQIKKEVEDEAKEPQQQRGDAPEAKEAGGGRDGSYGSDADVASAAVAQN